MLRPWVLGWPGLLLWGAFVMVVGRRESESLVEKLEGEENGATDGAKGSVGWGLLDATATAGKLFEYLLPRTTYGSRVTQYNVTEAGSDRLPDWLSLDPRRNLLEGVPGSNDKGRFYYIEVTASNVLDLKRTLSKDIFVIGVRREAAAVVAMATASSDARPLRDHHGNNDAAIVCAPGNAVTMATITVDADFDAMSGADRAKLLRAFGRHIEFPVTSLRMSAASGGGGDDVDDDDSVALVAGPGNVVSEGHGIRRAGVHFRWVVGCGVVTPRNMRILQRLETTAVDGSLAREIGRGIIGWHVTNSRTSGTTMRRKRLVPHPTATPMPTLRPPIGHPGATMVLLPTDGGPETRVVPSFASPSVSVTSERPPHRSKTKVRHPGKTRSSKQLSPVLSTKVTVEEANSELPVENNLLRSSPSPVTPVLPTQVDVTEYPRVPATPKPPEVLEPSLVFPVASVAATPTRPLSTTSTKIFTTGGDKTPPGTASPTPPSVGKTPGEGGGEGKTPALPTAVQPPAVDGYNFPPIQKNSIGQLSASVGELFTYTIPNDTFYDHEDGSTRNLELFFQTMDELSMAPNSWIRFNATTQTLYGMPLEEHAGRQSYMLAARDSGGRMEKYSFEIATQRRFLERKVNHEVKVSLDADYQRFMMDVDQRIDVAAKIARAHGDHGNGDHGNGDHGNAAVANMAVTRILEGSVEFYWTNLTLASNDPCPVDALQRISERMIRTDGTVDPEFTGSLEPHRVLSVEFLPRGPCLSQMSVRSGRRSEDPVEAPDTEVSASEVDPGVAKPIDGLIMTTIVPILILALVLALALVLFCAIWTRKKKEDNGVEVARSSRKGVPVIFADELEEKPGVPSKPLILADERPPVAPPDYDQATASNSPSSSPRSCCNDPLIPGHEHGATAAAAALHRSQHQHHHQYHHSANPSVASAYAQRGTHGHKRSGSVGRVPLQVSSRNPPPYIST